MTSSSSTLSLGYSPCPNDCFIFYALAHGEVAPELGWDIRLGDVEALNQLAKKGALDVTKISYHAFGHLTDDYVMLAQRRRTRQRRRPAYRYEGAVSGPLW